MSQPPASAGPPAGRKRAVPLEGVGLAGAAVWWRRGAEHVHLCLRRRDIVSVGRSEGLPQLPHHERCVRCLVARPTSCRGHVQRLPHPAHVPGQVCGQSAQRLQSQRGVHAAKLSRTDPNHAVQQDRGVEQLPGVPRRFCVADQSSGTDRTGRLHALPRDGRPRSDQRGQTVIHLGGHAMTDSTQQPKSRRSRSVIFVVAAFIVGFALIIGITALLININTRKQEAVAPIVKVVDIQDGETDPAVWGQNYPREYDRFMMTQNTDTPTAYGGSVKYSKLIALSGDEATVERLRFCRRFQRRTRPLLLADRSEGDAAPGRGEAARRVRQLPQRRCAQPDQEHGLGGVQSHALSRDQQHAALGHYVQRLPRSGDDGAAHHAPGLHQCDGEARHRRDQGDAPGDAHRTCAASATWNITSRATTRFSPSRGKRA